MLIACIVIILVLLLLDARRTPEVSAAVWIAVLWVVILASRPVAQWFDPSAGTFGEDPTGGSSLDRNLLLVLMFMAYCALVARKFAWGPWIAANSWLFALLLYSCLSIVWSDYSDVAFKRWVRMLGALLMVLLVLSERSPLEAAAAVIRRCSIVLVPLSLVLIKYYRAWAVGYNQWTGEEYLAGATDDKNSLGRLCMVSLLFAYWQFLSWREQSERRYSATSALPALAIFVTAVWLLFASKSSTSLACFVAGIAVLTALRTRLFRQRAHRLGTFLLVPAAVAAILMLWLEPQEELVAALGRDMTLTGRVFIWRDLLEAGTNPLFGVGYESFWLGERLAWFVATHEVNSAHNGYLELYLNLGSLGCILFAAWVLGSFGKAKRAFASQFSYGQLRLTILFIFLLYNMTESATRGTSLMFFVFLLAAVERPIERKPEGQEDPGRIVLHPHTTHRPS